MRTIYFSSIIILIFISCEVKQQPIVYGSDACEYCQMTIVDRQYASQLVNENGKAYNFDAIECMLNYSEENKDTDYQLYLINNFEKQGTFIDAKTATYLISPNISSPMGANLSAFISEKVAQQAREKYKGDLYNWESINKKIIK